VKRALVIASLVACTAPPPIATESDAQRAHVALAELARGRVLLVSRCTGCHHTPLPADHPAADWPRYLDDMAERAHITPDERVAITSYLVALSAPVPASR
jgi:cytochrome c5